MLHLQTHAAGTGCPLRLAGARGAAAPWTAQKPPFIKVLFTLKAAREHLMTAAVPDLLMLTRDSRISPYAMSAVPAWLWAEDASRVIWANATGAAALGAASPAELAAQQFEPTEPAAADVARLAGDAPAIRRGAIRTAARRWQQSGVHLFAHDTGR